MRVLICDGRSRASLQVCRSLFNKGYDIHVGESFQCSSFFSNSISAKVIYPNPDSDSDLFFKFILAYIEDNNIDFLFPVRDSTSFIISKYISQIPKKCKTFLPNHKDFLEFQDKGNVVNHCKNLNILIPKTIFGNSLSIKTYNDLVQILGEPIMAKPRISSGSRGIVLLKDQQSFESFISSHSKKLDEYIFQEYIPHGGALGVHSLYRKGKLVATNTHIRIREYPHSGGPSTLRRSGRHQISEYFADKLLSSINWNGLAMVEFRIHKETKFPYVMEINPRLWGSLAVDIHSGIDFPSLTLDLAYDKKPQSNLNPKKGIFVRWLFLGDFLWLITHKDKIRALKTFLNFQNQKFDILNSKDCLPVIGAIIDGLNSLFSLSRRKHVFSRGWNEK